MDNFSGSRPDKLVNLNLAAVAEPAVLWFETASKGARAVGEQLGQFITDRAKRNAETWLAMTQCGSPVKLMEAQERWVSDMVRDYSEQSHRVMELSRGVMQAFMSSVERRHDQ